MKNKILNEVNKVYKKEHPSFYTKITKKNLSELIIAREKLLLSLKLPKKIFQNSSLLDLGSGSGIYSLIYNHFGAKTDLVEYEKSFTNQSKNLFKKHLHRARKFGGRSINQINKIDILKDILTSEVNDKNFENFKINYKKISKVAKEYKKNIKYLNKINFFDQNYQMNFLQEIIELFELLNNSDCNLKKVHNFLNKTKFIFQGTVGIGMNYYVGYKL